jgi:hypothetical protein
VPDGNPLPERTSTDAKEREEDKKMKKVLAFGLVALMATVAQADFTLTGLSGDSVGVAGDALNTTIPYNFAGPDFTPGDFHFVGNLTDGGAASFNYASDARFKITNPASEIGYTPALTTVTTYTGTIPIDFTVTGAQAIFTGTSVGGWTFEMYEAYDDGVGVDNIWSDLTIQVMDYEPPFCVWAEDFEAGIPADWTTIDNLGNGGWLTNADYARANETGGAGLAAAVDSDAIGSLNVDAELWTPEFTVPAAAELTFQERWRPYTGGLDELGDVDISTDGGANWANLLQRTELDNLTAVLTTIDLSSYAGQDVNVRWHYYNANYEYYWQIDDVCLTPEPASLALLLLGGLALLRRR